MSYSSSSLQTNTITTLGEHNYSDLPLLTVDTNNNNSSTTSKEATATTTTTTNSSLTPSETSRELIKRVRQTSLNKDSSNHHSSNSKTNNRLSEASSDYDENIEAFLSQLNLPSPTPVNYEKLLDECNKPTSYFYSDEINSDEIEQAHCEQEEKEYYATASASDTENKDDNDQTADQLKLYKLRAETKSSSSTATTCDWVRPPHYFDEEAIRDLSNEQIQLTLDYFILSGFRVSQMTKTYDDIDAVTKLLDEKEKDLELAATIGKQLLEKDQQLEAKIEFLEIQLDKTTEMVNQLRYDITLKDQLLKTFIESEYDESSENELMSNHESTSRKLTHVNVEVLNEYKKKIQYLESENDMLRNKADYFEKETASVEAKEAEIVQNCARECETSQSKLRSAQSELKLKNAECQSQQEEIQGLFSQIYELQLRIKTLTRENSDLHSIHETSKHDLIEQINELKDKYNECLHMLTKTQEEMTQLRKKNSSLNHSSQTTSTSNLLSSNHKRNLATKAASVNSYLDATTNTALVANANYEDDDDDDLSLNSRPSTVFIANKSSSMYATFMATNVPNGNSLAAELFSSMAKEFRTQNGCMSSASMPQQVSQSSDFIRKVKQKLTKQIPGSTNVDSMQSDSEIEMMLNNSSSHFDYYNQEQNPTNPISQQHQQLHRANSYFNPKFPNCPTPDSCLSTGSASVYNNNNTNIARSHSATLFSLPEKLQIVKPIEGSQTLQHWQYLATPNLGCLFDQRPGIAIRGAHHDLLDIVVNNKKEFLSHIDEDQDDGICDDEEFTENEEDLDEFDYEFYNEKRSINYANLESELNEVEREQSSKNMRSLTPSKVQLLTQLLEKEEKAEASERGKEEESELSHSDGYFMGFFKQISTRYFRSTSLSEEQNSHKSNSDPPPKPTMRKSPSKARNTGGTDCHDPDTPPSSPINLPAPNVDTKFQLLKNISSFLTTAKSPGTPPGTPTHELEETVSSSSSSSDEELQLQQDKSVFESFFDQIVNKLGALSHFVRSSTNRQETNHHDVHTIKEFDVEESELCEINNNAGGGSGEKSVKCSTPPPSPSKFSPPLPDLDYQAEYTEEEMRKSAFVKVAKLNPLLNQRIDLASLLGSLSSLKRTQRFDH